MYDRGYIGGLTDGHSAHAVGILIKMKHGCIDHSLEIPITRFKGESPGTVDIR